ncbi:MAG: DUF1697 domain-containing protein [Betaproteobacteria bacterium]
MALLRAVNLAGRNMISMGDLRLLLAGQGLQDPRSLLNSGNLLFRSGAVSPARLERQLEDAAAKRLGLQTEFFVRSARDWGEVIADNPFPAEAARDPGHLLVLFLKDAPGPEAVTALQRAITGREVVRASGRHAYVVYPDGMGRSRLTTLVIEKKLGTRATGRNWNTVLKLGALVAPRGGTGKA